MKPAGPGHSLLEVPAPTPGLWTVSDGTRIAYAASDTADPPEWADLRATATKLQGVISATHGSAHFLDSGGTPSLRLVEPAAVEGDNNWIGLRRNHAHVTTGIALTPLLPAWAALPLLMVVLLVAWRREGR
jgi:hypothetical protein